MPPSIVSFESMLIGFTDAVGRVQEAARRGDSLRMYNGVFDALNWAVALDDRVGKLWVPDGETLGWRWRQRVGHGAEIMGGVRFARNSVHHQWSDAMRAAPGAMLPTKLPTVLERWVWCDPDELPEPDQAPQPDQERIYREQMQGRPVRGCLDVLNGAFYTLGRLLEPWVARQA
jgi:hypothetical protein